MAKSYSCCWESGEKSCLDTQDTGGFLSSCHSLEVPLYANGKKQSPVNIPLPCEGMSVSPWVHLWLLQRMRCTKPIWLCGQGKTASPGSSQEMKGFFQIIVQNCSSSEFLFTTACPADRNGCLDRLTPPGWCYSSLQPAFLRVSKLFFAFVTAKLVSVISVVCSIQDSHCPWNFLTFFIRCQKQKCIYISVEKQNPVAEHPPGCTSLGPYPIYHVQVDWKYQMLIELGSNLSKSSSCVPR